MKTLALLLLLICHPALIQTAAAQTAVEHFNWGDFGETHIYRGGTQGLELILTDNQHQQAGEHLAATLSREHKLAAVLNMDSYLAHVAASRAQCFDAATPLSVYVQDVEQAHQFVQFTPGFINGLGSAGSYLLAMLEQAPAGLFRGGFSNTLATQINLSLPPCKPAAGMRWQADNKTLSFAPNANPATPWQAFNSPSQRWLTSVPLMDNWQAASQAFENQLARREASDDNNLDKLPLVILDAKAAAKPEFEDAMALVISGDGGWANIDKDIANNLSAQGIPVVGWNSLNYFWQGKNPQIAGQDLQAVVNFYRAHWHKNKVILIGFSMGADVMPFMVNQLNTETQAQLLSVNLLNPSTSVDFTFHLSGWLNTQSEAPYQTYPEVKNWQQWPSNCFYSDKDQSLCTQLEKLDSREQQQIKLFYLPGDHHFDGNYTQLIQLILAHSAPRPTTQSPSAP